MGFLIVGMLLMWFFGFVTGVGIGINVVLNQLKAAVVKKPRIRAEELNPHKYND